MNNENRHLCRTCIYRASPIDKIDLKMNCNYIGVTGRMRRCPVESCDEYVKGKRKVVRKKIHY